MFLDFGKRNTHLATLRKNLDTKQKQMAKKIIRIIEGRKLNRMDRGKFIKKDSKCEVDLKASTFFMITQSKSTFFSIESTGTIKEFLHFPS